MIYTNAEIKKEYIASISGQGLVSSRTVLSRCTNIKISKRTMLSGRDIHTARDVVGNDKLNDELKYKYLYFNIFQITHV